MFSIASLRRLVWLLCLAVFLPACTEKEKLPIPEECKRAHKHVLALLKKKAEQEKASQKGKALKAADKTSTRWNETWEKLQFKKLSPKQKQTKEQGILKTCAKTFRKSPERIFCTLALTDLSEMKHCYDKKADLSKYKKNKKSPAKTVPKATSKVPSTKPSSNIVSKAPVKTAPKNPASQPQK